MIEEEVEKVYSMKVDSKKEKVNDSKDNDVSAMEYDMEKVT